MFYVQGVVDICWPVHVPTKLCVGISFEGIGAVWIQNHPVIVGSTEVSRKVLYGGAVRTTGVFTELGDLVSFIVDVALCALLEEFEISDDRAVVEPMVKGRC